MKKVFIISVIFALSAISVFAQNRLSVRVSAETTIETERIELAQIAQISGDAEKAERLKKISLGYAPNIGMMREIVRSQIVLAMNAAGFSENEIVLDCPPKILIRRFGQEISQDQIREAIKKAVLSQFADEKIEAKIVRLEIPQKIEVTTGQVEIRVNAAGIRNVFTRFSLPVEIRIDNKIVRSFAATVEVEAFTDVFVAVKDLSANTKITEADVKLERRKLTKSLINYLREPQKLRGAMLTRNITSGTEITTDVVASAVVIRAGDSIRIEAQSGNLKIIISGEARSSGKIGDRIAVKNLQSKAILQAVVVDEGLVKVNF